MTAAQLAYLAELSAYAANFIPFTAVTRMSGVDLSQCGVDAGDVKNAFAKWLRADGLVQVTQGPEPK